MAPVISPTAEDTVSRTVAAFVTGLAWADVPGAAQHATRRTVANVVALAVGARSSTPVETTVRMAVDDLALTGAASVLGRHETLPAPWAALVNGMAAHVEDFDDTYLPCVLHPGAPVVPAALAAAGIVGASGETTMAGIVAGVEIASRLGDSLWPDHFDRGWHVTGTVGTVGAACAAARVLGLDERRTGHAIAFAATQAAGHTEQLGSMTKSLHAGRAAANGLEAALLAREGMAGAAEPLAGRRGLAALMSADVDWRGFATLGNSWLVEANALKPYSCGIVSHPVIDAALALRDAIGTEEIEEVRLEVHPRVLDVMGLPNPTSGLETKFSVYHCFAVGLLDGAGGPAEFSDDRAQAPDVVALRGRVVVTLDPTVAPDSCRARVRLTSGAVHDHVVDHATGSVERPMTDEQLRAKFDALVPSVADADALWAAAYHLDGLDSVADLFAPALGSSPG